MHANDLSAHNGRIKRERLSLSHLWRHAWRRAPLRPTPPRPAAPRWPLLAGLIAAVWLSYYLYSGSLGLPYLQEDSTHILWLASRGPLEPFLSARGAPAYRPLGKSIIKLWYLLLGHHDIAWLRFHNIAFNALSLALIGRIVSWIDRGRSRYVGGGLAAIFFAVLPFAYQAIPWINNFFYPLENLLLLGMTAVYWQARQRHSTRLLILALFLAFLAPFQIEYGVVAGGILLALELILWRQGRQEAPWLGGVLLGVLVNALFVLRWMTIPKQAYDFGPPTLNRIFLIGTYFLQGLLFPIAPLGKPLVAAGWVNDVTAVWLIGLPGLTALAVYLWRRGRGAILLLGGAWFVLLNLPALVFVNFDYVINGPRLLYPPGVGTAWLWGVVGGEWIVGSGKKNLQSLVSNPFRPVTFAIFLLAVLAANVWFVRDRVAHYRLAEEPVRGLTAAAGETPDDEQLLVVNFPSWITPPRDPFPLGGHHGAAILPFYIGIDALVAAHTGEAQAVRAIQVTHLKAEQPYYYGMLGEKVDYDRLSQYLRESGPVYLGEWTATEIALRPAGRVTAVPPPVAPIAFGDPVAPALEVALDDLGQNGRRLELSLTWRIVRPVEQNLTVFVHLYGPDGRLVDQADGYPLRGLAPFWLWGPGQTLRDGRTLTLPAEAPPGVYQVAVGVYDAAAGERLPAFSPDGERFPDDAAILHSLTWN